MLRWPDEPERWPGETLLVDEPAWKCGAAKPGTGPLATLRPALFPSLPPEAAARAIYERAVLRYRQGALEGTEQLDPALLAAQLQPAARFLRLEAKVDPPEGFVALAKEWPQLAVLLRAAQRLHELARHAELLDLTSAADQLPPSPMQRHVLFLRALSFHALQREPQMLDAISRALAQPGSEQGLEPFRALAISALGRSGYDAEALDRVARPRQPALEQFARRALAAGRFDTARDAAQALAGDLDPRWRAQGLALLGEIAWRSGDGQGAEAAFEQLFDPARKLGGYRDPAALQLAQSLVVVQAGRRDPGVARKLDAELTVLRDRVHLKAMAQVEALLAAARETAVQQGEQPVALGEVDVLLPPSPPPAPKIEIELPEPRSLLAIPAQDGSLRDWFETRGAP